MNAVFRPGRDTRGYFILLHDRGRRGVTIGRLGQGFDGFERLLARPALPGFPQFFLMQRRPLHDEANRASWEPSVQNVEVVYPELGLLVSIDCVKVWRVVVVVAHTYDDAVEPAEFRHRLSTPQTGHQFLHSLARELHIEIVRASVYLFILAPDDRAMFVEMRRFEKGAVLPRREYTCAGVPDRSTSPHTPSSYRSQIR